MQSFELRKVLPALGLAAALAFSAQGFAKEKAQMAKAKKVAAAMTFEQCCEKTGNDSGKCLKMKGVTGKKEKKGQKWQAKACPQAADEGSQEM